MEEQKELLVKWLQDAHAMERAIVKTLEEHKEDFKDYPDVQGRVLKHLEETKNHADLVKGCLDRLGEEESGTKSWLSEIMGKMQGMSTEMADDTILKNAAAEYATEHTEMIMYKKIMVLASQCGETEIAETAKKIFEEEKAMGDWIMENIEDLVRTYAAQKEIED